MGTRYTHLVNAKFNALTITGISHKNSNSQYFLKYRCDCGNTGTMLGSAIVNGYSKSCGCTLIKQFQERIDNMIGRNIGRLSILSFSHMGDHGTRYMNCTCACGMDIVLSIRQINEKQSCGCISNENRVNRMTKHGMYYTKIYKVYDSIKQRCNNQKHKYYRLYGGRGIRNMWGTLEDFLYDMQDTYKEGLSIDRIDVNGNYCKENCHWIKLVDQQRNKTNTRYTKINGIIIPAISISENEGISVRHVLKKYGRYLISGEPVEASIK